MRLIPFLPLLFAAVATPALSDPGVRDAVRMSQLQRGVQNVPERRMTTDTLPGQGGYDQSGQEEAGPAGDAARRGGRLSPEERRALRRQIDEAGADLYQGRR